MGSWSAARHSRPAVACKADRSSSLTPRSRTGAATSHVTLVRRQEEDGWQTGDHSREEPRESREDDTTSRTAANRRHSIRPSDRALLVLSLLAQRFSAAIYCGLHAS